MLEMNTQARTASGFSLIELLVTVALIAILMALGVPSFTTFQRNSELTSRANSLLASMNAARGEAMKRGRDAVVAPLDGANWSSGAIAFVDINNNLTYDSATDILVFSNNDPIPNYLTITATGPANASPPYIRFDAQGYPKPASPDPRNFSFSITRNDVSGTEEFSQTRRLIVAITGRGRVCKPTSASDANCTASITTTAN